MHIIGLLPHGHEWGAEHPGTIIFTGQSAHAGRLVFERWTFALDALLKQPYDFFHIIEYDTVNLTSIPLDQVPGVISTYRCKDGDAWCLLSPWVMDRPTLQRLWEACSAELASTDPVPECVNGLLDRWLGYVYRKHGVPVANITRTLSYTGHVTWHSEVSENSIEWVHGRKRKADFGDLWPSA